MKCGWSTVVDDGHDLRGEEFERIILAHRSFHMDFKTQKDTAHGHCWNDNKILLIRFQNKEFKLRKFILGYEEALKRPQH